MIKSRKYYLPFLILFFWFFVLKVYASWDSSTNMQGLTVSQAFTQTQNNFKAVDGSDNSTPPGMLWAGTSVYFEGATDDAFELRLTVANPTSDVTVSIPATTGTLEFIDVAQIITATKTYNGSSPFIFEGATDDANEMTLSITDPTADVVVTVPATTGTLALIGQTRSSMFTSSGTFTAPVGITKVYLTMIAGGSSAKGGSNGGGGAGGGYIVNYPYTVVAGNNYTVTVGAGGTAVSGTNNGIAGGTTTFDSVSVSGGAAVTGSTGGVGGGGSFNASGGTLGTFIQKSGNGGDTNGAGGSTPYGLGGQSAGGSAGAPQDAAANTGAGGGNGNGGGGGAGGSGFVLIEY